MITLMEDNSKNIVQTALNVLECPVCKDYMLPPIVQCVQGHSVCQVCRKRCESCPCCRSAFASTRNIALETLASTIPLPCPNAIWGCTKLLKCDERKEHTSECCFKAIQCSDTLAKCSWTGSINDFKQHCLLPTHRMLESGSPLTINLNVPYLSFSVSAHNDIFVFKHKFVQATNVMYWAVQYIGAGNSASNYFYEISVTSELSSKKASFQQVCQSVYIDDEELFTDDHSISVNIFCIVPIARSLNNDFQFGVNITQNELLNFRNWES